MQPIILASSSPRRKEILAMAGLPFTVVPSEYEEDNSLPLPPSKLVAQLALGKARWVAERHPGALVIGADTLVAMDGRVYGKPRDEAELAAMFKQFSGRSHSAFSGIALVQDGHEVTESVETKVYFRKLGGDEIARYAKTDEWRDKAGGYGIQATGALFIEKIEGDYFNVVGLPLCRLGQRLDEFGIRLV